MKRTLALLLASVMALSLLAGCGGTGDSAKDDAADETVATQKPADDKKPGGGTSEDAGDAASDEVTLTLNRSKVTLSAEGATFRLKASVEPAVDGLILYASDDTSVAAVSDDGTVTAVAPGSAVITVTCGGAEAVCAVTCDWEEAEVPAPETPPAEQNAPEQNAPAPPPAASADVDLAAFYEALLSKYDMAAMEDISGMGDVLDNLYAGLSGLDTKQSLVCVAMMTGVVCEITLIELADAADVEAARAILQARVDYQLESGAFYPAVVDGWKNNSRIVVNGSCIMLVAHQDCDAIVDDFNALF